VRKTRRRRRRRRRSGRRLSRCSLVGMQSCRDAVGRLDCTDRGAFHSRTLVVWWHTSPSHKSYRAESSTDWVLVKPVCLARPRQNIASLCSEKIPRPIAKQSRRIAKQSRLPNPRTPTCGAYARQGEARHRARPISSRERGPRGRRRRRRRRQLRSHAVVSVVQSKERQDINHRWYSPTARIVVLTAAARTGARQAAARRSEAPCAPRTATREVMAEVVIAEALIVDVVRERWKWLGAAESGLPFHKKWTLPSLVSQSEQCRLARGGNNTMPLGGGSVLFNPKYRKVKFPSKANLVLVAQRSSAQKSHPFLGSPAPMMSTTRFHQRAKGASRRKGRMEWREAAV